MKFNSNSKLLIIPILLSLAATTPFAARVAAQGQGYSGRGSRIAQALNLTDDQKAQLKPLLRDAHSQFRSIKNDPNLTPDQKREKLFALRAQIRSEIDQILTPAQQQELQTLRAQWRQQRAQQQNQAAPSPGQ